jgi:hypothetical protein
MVSRGGADYDGLRVPGVHRVAVEDHAAPCVRETAVSDCAASVCGHGVDDVVTWLRSRGEPNAAAGRALPGAALRVGPTTGTGCSRYGEERASRSRVDPRPLGTTRARDVWAFACACFFEEMRASAGSRSAPAPLLRPRSYSVAEQGTRVGSGRPKGLDLQRSP